MASPGLMARFETMDEADAALKALENRGVDGADLTLIGTQAARARQVHTVTGPDRRVTRKVIGLVLRGGVWGSLGGLLVSVVIVALSAQLLSGVRDHLTAQLMVVLAFTMLGSVVGIFATVERGVGFSESWHLAFQDVREGEVWLAVLVPPPDAESRLRELGATEIVMPPRTKVPAEVGTTPRAE